MVIYADSLMLLNAMINYLVLLLTAKISGEIIKRKRLLLAAGLGAIYALAVLFPLFYPLSGWAGKATVCFAMALIAFGWGRRLVKLSLMTIGVSLAFAGAAMVVSLMGGNMMANISTMYIPVDMKTLIVVTAAVYGGMGVIFKNTASRQARSIGLAEITVLNKSISLRYLPDTGNSLTDPVTNQPVTVVTMEVLKRLTGMAAEADPVTLLYSFRRAYPEAKTRLIPFCTVGSSGGMMMALKCDSIKLDGREIKGGLIAFSPNTICDDGSYEAISGCIGG